ncbi:MAG: VWA domain-containing protein, partial [Chloroflexales bacterium]|nr:VWA domain-containing protein [Chloroflexales bacterium]
MPRLSFIYPHALWLLLLLVPLCALALALPRRLGPQRFWISLGLRSALIGALVLSLAGTQLVRGVDELTTVFLVDSSDSVSPSARGRAEAFVQESLRAMRASDKAAVVVFGGNALVERAPSAEPMFGKISSVPVAARTDIEQALQLGIALFPADTRKRLVLLSDGGENSGSAVEAARIAASRNVRIDVVDMAGPSGNEALVARLQAPARARDGQSFQLETTIESTVAQQARLRIFGDNALLSEQTVSLAPGTNVVRFPLIAAGQGFQRYRAQIEPQSDARVQNNEAAA